MCCIVDLYDKTYGVILPADVVSDLQQITAVSVCVAECVETTDKCAPTQGKVKISPVRFVDMVVNGKAVSALKVSGAQILLISQNLSQEIPNDIMGRIVIHGVVGSALVPLTNVGVQLAAEPGTINVGTAELSVVCGIVDLYDKEDNMILPSDVVSDLQQIPTVLVYVAE